MEKKIIIFFISVLLTGCGYKIVKKHNLNMTVHYSSYIEIDYCYKILHKSMPNLEKEYLINRYKSWLSFPFKNTYDIKLEECKRDNFCSKK